MTLNLASNPDLTLEQDTYLRLQYLGYLMSLDPVTQNDFRQQADFFRSERTRDNEGNVVTTRQPIDTIQVAFRLNPELLAQAQICGLPLYSAVNSVNPTSPVDLGCLPGSGSLQPPVPEEFFLTVLVDDSSSIITDENNNYPIEG